VVVVNIHPTIKFNDRSGMATSSRKLWQGELWNKRVLLDQPQQLARLLFGYENPPGSQYVAGSQDHLGLCLPGASRLYYKGLYWPSAIDSITDEETCRWLERVLVLVELQARPPGYDPLSIQNITPETVKDLALAGESCWQGILKRDLTLFGQGLTNTHHTWRTILPNTTNQEINQELAKYETMSGVFGVTTSGCGGGYIVLAVDPESRAVRHFIPEQHFSIKVRSNSTNSQQTLPLHNDAL